MANEKNLIPQAHILSVEEASKGGKASAESRKLRKRTQDILRDLLNADAKDYAAFSKISQDLGMPQDISVHDLYAFVKVLNSMKTNDLSDIERLMKFVGESNEAEEKAEFSIGTIEVLPAVNEKLPEGFEDADY